jgi:very-short-patch-repair endonuclease
MRRDSTKAENTLWQALRGRKIEGHKFKRQVPLGPYIVDFACFESKLVVEVDGFQHATALEDVRRDRYFEGQGYTVLRFWNDEVVKETEGVIMRIRRELGMLERRSPSEKCPLSCKFQGLGYAKPRNLLSPPQGGR